MSILEEIKQYAEDCINGTIISCKKHKWACERLLRDIDNIGTEDFPYVWNEAEAEKIVRWFELLRHSKGILSKQPINLTVWQKFFLCQIYGWRNINNGYKRFNKSFIEVARKQAKSQMEAGVVLYEISTQSTKNKEVYEAYCAGTKREQSKVIFSECELMLKGSPLATKFNITRDKITHIKTGSYLKALCKEDGKKGDGTNPAILVLDEFHQHATTEFYDLGLGSNTKESLLMIITTAGMDLNYPCYTQEYKYCSNLLCPNNEVTNDSYFTDICELDIDDDIDDENNWYKANPLRMTYAEGRKKIRDEYKIAKEIPEKMIPFLTKCLNVWVQAKENGYMDMAKWNACEVKKIPFDLRNKDVFVGVDISAKIDLTSVTFVIPIMDKEIKKYIIFSHSFIPNRDKLLERTIKDKMPYDAWERDGFLEVTDTPTVNQKSVEDYIIGTCKKNEWNIYNICPDPHNSTLFAQELSDMGYDVVEVYQSAQSLNESTVGFREDVYEGNVIYLHDPLLNFAMGNTVIRYTNGNIKVDKDHTIQRIDPIDALLCGYQLARYYQFEEKFNLITALDNLKVY